MTTGGGDMSAGGRRLLAWVTLRRVVEASHADVVAALWPDGDRGAPARVEELVEAMRCGDARLPPSLRTRMRGPGTVDPVADLRAAEAEGYRLVTPDDPAWPACFRGGFPDLRRPRNRAGDAGDAGGTGDVSDSGVAASHPGPAPAGAPDPATGSDGAGVRGQVADPFALWTAGDGDLAGATRRTVTLVGTRAPSRYGTEAAEMLGSTLAAAGYTVVSGGALGIDRAAHAAALRAGGTTVAVAACGPGVTYPSANRPLFRDIRRAGLVMTEYPPGTRPARHRFLTRNRLVAALGQGTVVVEAPYRSGALNTCNWAELLVRPVMAVPGPVTSSGFTGCHERIRSGRAALVTRAEDVRELIEPLGSVDSSRQLELDFHATGSQTLTLDELKVFDAAGVPGDVSGRMDDLVGGSGLPLAVVVRVIRDLEARGLVVRDGDRWVKATR
ncbi:DNA-processing protein DprA [Corynebacterium bovis]|uniref:DNA-processing protein DprA n=1 Tax=Corynebacterium bovis TaxID=36808 RepID=UPI002652DD84|nr:DNA-processing protein DprA [Corynebacterium bovis]MDN8578815.1 DNA-processing protein DprA [Corynebacterium bovis]